jgi:CRISPR-associated protein Cmr1
MEVKIHALTPIWTGGIEAGKCDRIHETSILGSLRWWMEVLVRGMEGVVCDPTAEKSKDRCGLDPQKFNTKKYRELQDEIERRKYLRDAGVCDVCQIFGATGWKRQFRLEVEDKNTSTIQLEDKYAKNRSLTARKGEFTIKIQRLNRTFDPDIIGGLIQFIADYSALGARTQMGFGVIKIEGDRIPVQPLCNWLIGTSGYKKYENLPSLNNIFLAKIKPKNSNFDEKGIKHDLRQLFMANEDKPEAKSSKPILKKDKKKVQIAEEKDSYKDSSSENKEDKSMTAKIKISQPYKDKNGNTVMRMWGWIPKTTDIDSSNWNRDNYEIQDWRKMNSSRNSVLQNQKDAQVFLRSLLGLSEDM